MASEWMSFFFEANLLRQFASLVSAFHYGLFQ